MRILIFVFCFIAFTNSFVFATVLSSWDKRMFYASFQTSCEQNAKKTSTMSRDNIDRWCQCVNYETIKIITKEDLLPSQAASLNQKTGTAIEVCKKKSGLLK